MQILTYPFFWEIQSKQMQGPSMGWLPVYRHYISVIICQGIPNPVSLALAGDSSPLWGTWEACISVYIISNHKLFLLCRGWTLYRGTNEKTWSLNRAGPEPLLAKPLASIPSSLLLINLLIHRGKKTIKWQAPSFAHGAFFSRILCCCSIAQSDSVSPRSAAHQASLSFTNPQSFLKLTSIESVMPSNYLIPFPPAFNLFQHQGLFQWVGSSHQVVEVLELQLQHNMDTEIVGLILNCKMQHWSFLKKPFSLEQSLYTAMLVLLYCKGNQLYNPLCFGFSFPYRSPPSTEWKNWSLRDEQVP